MTLIHEGEKLVSGQEGSKEEVAVEQCLRKDWDVSRKVLGVEKVACERRTKATSVGRC